MPRIGKPLSASYSLGALPHAESTALIDGALASRELASLVVEVRRQGASMIACIVLGDDAATARACKRLGFRLKGGGRGVFGVDGDGAATLFDWLPDEDRAWLSAPSEPSETKLVLLAGGYALASLHAEGGKARLALR